MTFDPGYGFVVWLPIPIVPKARPRVTRHGTHKPDKYAANLNDIGMLLRSYLPQGWPLDRSYELLVEVVLERRNGGDADNLLGTVMDAGNRVVWQDDCQVASVKLRKLIHTNLLEPSKARVEVRLMEPTGFEPPPRKPSTPLPRTGLWQRERGAADKRTAASTASGTRRPADAGKGPSRGGKA